MKKINLFVFAAIAAVFVSCASTSKAVKTTMPAIGDVGQGGGIVFMVEGKAVYECAELPDRVKYEDATEAAKAYNGGGFTDWHLSNRAELDAIYQNLRAKEIVKSDGLYWTSELQDEEHAWGQRFNSGGTGAHELAKGHNHNVFAVRTYQQ